MGTTSSGHTVAQRRCNVNRRILTERVALLAFGLAPSLACSAADKGSSFKTGTTSGGGGATVGAGGENINASTSATTTGSSGSGIVVPDAAVGSGGAGGSGMVDPDAACAVASATATLAPVNMFMTFDRSGSMAMNNKWQDATGALIAFLRDPGTAGLRIAFRFFPDNMPVAGCDDQGCSIDACRQPLIDLGALSADPAPQDMQEGALVGALMTAMPGGRGGGNGGGTPLFAALGG